MLAETDMLRGEGGSPHTVKRRGNGRLEDYVENWA